LADDAIYAADRLPGNAQPLEQLITVGVKRIAQGITEKPFRGFVPQPNTTVQRDSESSVPAALEQFANISVPHGHTAFITAV
jgi:hypothetical protein